MTHYFICQPVDLSKSPFLAMLGTDEHADWQRAMGHAAITGRQSALKHALRMAFGEACDYARLTAAEYWQATRAQVNGQSDDTGGTPAAIDPVKPLPRKPRGGVMAQRAARAAALSVQA